VRFRKPEDVDAVVISHMHADHFIDLVALRYALRYGNRANDRRISLYLPPGGDRILRDVVAPFAGEGGSFLDDVYDVRTYDPSEALRIGDVTLHFAETVHYIACFAMRFEFGDSALVYSADTAPCAALVAFARGANALLCEATLSLEEEAAQPRGHLSAREAGALAASAGVGSLLLSHYPASADVALMQRLAAAEFGGRIRVVDDAARLPISAG
jgi:ribonuclease BN (tRNA processing enzyme)